MATARAFRGFRLPAAVVLRACAGTSGSLPLGYRLGIQPLVPGGFPRRPTLNRHPITAVPGSALNRPARYAENCQS